MMNGQFDSLVMSTSPQRNNNNGGTTAMMPVITQSTQPDDFPDVHNGNGTSSSGVNNNNNNNHNNNNTTAAVQVDRVNGIGMWRSWTRSFNTPLLALLDLFDNAVDASMCRKNAGLVNPTYTHPKISVHVDEIGSGGILIRNSCESVIPPMKQVLEVYRSCKNNAAIGENGIGVKHACANLSTLSILISKTNQSIISIGIIMEELQKPEGVVLPSISFNVLQDDIQQCLVHLCCQTAPTTWGIAMAAYGEEGGYMNGIDRILQHVTQMRNVWRQYDHVFTTIITTLRHRGHAERDDDGDEHNPDSTTHHVYATRQHDDEDNNQSRSLQVLTELGNDLARLYIHLDSIDITVQHMAVNKLHWEKRLVETTVFEIPIKPNILWKHDQNLFANQYTNDRTTVNNNNNIPTIKFILGFDPQRASSKRQSACLMLLYSRQSGRLIKEYEDARAMMHLSAGSTDYTQGLTVILDDSNSTLPLNPTKQDLAFGYTEHGQIHRMNLMEWSAAVIHFYWNWHFERHDCKKALLTQSVLKSKQELEHLVQQTDGNSRICIPPMSAAQYTTFSNTHLDWKTTYDKIRVSKKGRNEAVPMVGRDSLVRFRPVQIVAAAAATARAAAPRGRSPRKEIMTTIAPAALSPLPTTTTTTTRTMDETAYNDDIAITIPRKQSARKVAARKVAATPVNITSADNDDNDNMFTNDGDGDDNDGDYGNDDLQTTSNSRAAKRRRTTGGNNNNNNNEQGAVQYFLQHERQQREWETEKKRLEREIHEQHVILSKTIKDKQQESQRRVACEKERDNLEEKLEAAEVKLETERASHKETTQKLTTMTQKLEKRNKKYYDLKSLMGEMKRELERNSAALVAANAKINNINNNNNTAIKSDDATVKSNNKNADASSTAASTPNKGDKQLREAYNKMKRYYEAAVGQTKSLEKRLEAMKTNVNMLEEENFNLSRQLRNPSASGGESNSNNSNGNGNGNGNNNDMDDLDALIIDIDGDNGDIDI